ncbi:winged helix-turn-helix domain-containing protein [Actinokineospora sp. NBRC 105648]|uniref:ArsR/SmtB family transcription factor n=1 Tax=Actinokineospora sp. NBRC 105648 TaxID=3032206 RepID=UPI0024A2D7FE|nr:winged helix-turn-helix domain-containing protein [Actinokineospora sp. NBRC 105648]GLZ43356.1 transcriptional regulator [Actinokineospora sp. NBRC 105648]
MTSRRRPATTQEVKALAHPLRLRILRLCGQAELTNKQLADRVERDPGTVLYHVRLLVSAGLLEQAEVRTGPSGAMEKPYRSTGRSWWLEGPLREEDTAFAPVEAFQEDLAAAGPDSLLLCSRFALHLSDTDLAELDRRIHKVLDDYIDTDHHRTNHPLHGGAIILHRMAE